MMRVVMAGMLWLTVAAKSVAVAATDSGGAEAANTASILRLPLPEQQRTPLLVFTCPDDTTVVELPYQVDDWFGRGFTMNPDQMAGDFALRFSPGKKRFSVTPLVEDAHRVIQLVVNNRLVALEFMPAASRLASVRSLIFFDAQAEQEKIRRAVDAERSRRTEVVRSAKPMQSLLREPTDQTRSGLTRFMRLLLNMPADMAANAARANPALQLVDHRDDPEEPFGHFTLKLNFAIRDTVTDSLGFCVTVTNVSGRKLVFDPSSWLVRSGAQVYPIRTVDFAGEVAPQASVVALLVLDRAPDGKPTLLLPDNAFRLSVQEVAAVSPRPVVGVDLSEALKPE